MKKRGRKRKEGPREPSGKLQRLTRSEREAATRAQIEARSKALGIWPTPPVRAWGESISAFEGRQRAYEQMIRACAATVSLPWMGCNAGRRIAGEEDVADLWQVIQTIRQRRTNYLSAIGACSDHAPITQLGVAPTDDAIDEVVRRDLRPEEERALAAIRAWNEIDASLDWTERRVVYDVVILDGHSVVALVPILRKLAEMLFGITDMRRKSENRHVA